MFKLIIGGAAVAVTVLTISNHFKLKKIMGDLSNITAVLGRIDAATNNIAEDIRNLKDQISTGLTPEQVADLQQQLEAKATTLEGIAADTSDPVPGNGGQG